MLLKWSMERIPLAYMTCDADIFLEDLRLNIHEMDPAMINAGTWLKNISWGLIQLWLQKGP